MKSSTIDSIARSILALALAVILPSLAGCASWSRPELFPNSDPTLRKTSAAFAADAATRFPYKFDAPRAGQATARAQVGYSLNWLEVANLSEEVWTDVELWINQQYVVHLERMEPRILKRLTFKMFYDEKGYSFPTDNTTMRITRLEILRDGKMYDVRVQLAD